MCFSTADVYYSSGWRSRRWCWGQAVNVDEEHPADDRFVRPLVFNQNTFPVELIKPAFRWQEAQRPVLWDATDSVEPLVASAARPDFAQGNPCNRGRRW